MSSLASRALSIVVALPLVLLAAGCGDDGAQSQGAPTGAATTVPPAGTPTPSATSNAAPVVPEGKVYTDDDGFQITFPAGWTLSQDVSGLQVAGAPPQPSGAFADNVGVISEQTGRDDLTVEQYLDLSVKAAPKLISNFQVVSRTVRTVGDEEQGVLEYTGTTSGYDLHFLAVIEVEKGKAYVATLTATPQTYAGQLPVSEPVLASLHTA